MAKPGSQMLEMSKKTKTCSQHLGNIFFFFKFMRFTTPISVTNHIVCTVDNGKAIPLMSLVFYENASICWRFFVLEGWSI